MKRVLVVAFGIAVFPSMAVSQTELGLDAGATITRGGGSTLTTIGIPTSGLRIGFVAGEQMIFESMVRLTFVHSSGRSATALVLNPGLNYLFGERAYARGEVGIILARAGGETDSQVGFGAAIGARNPIADGAALFRVEGGVRRWTDPGFTQFHFIVGISAIIG